MTPDDGATRPAATGSAASSSTHRGTPETAGELGGVNPAAEPPPTVRARGASRVLSVYAIIAGGLALLALTLFGDAETATTVANAVIGVLIVGLGALAVAGVGDRRVLGWVGMIAGVPLGISGLVVSPIELADVARLVGGAALFMGSVGLLATEMRNAAAEEEPQSRVEAS